LSDHELGDLRRDRPIAPGAILPPDWPLPEGFPPADAPVRGLHLGRLAYLLRAEDDRLRAVTALYPPV
jgi:tRNA pseudouridine55 synthase